jgi:hypothetical protein
MEALKASIAKGKAAEDQSIAEPSKRAARRKKAS